MIEMLPVVIRKHLQSNLELARRVELPFSLAPVVAKAAPTSAIHTFSMMGAPFALRTLF